MKNLLPLTFLFLIGISGYLQAQEGCIITSANYSADSSCLFLTWAPFTDSLNKPITVRSSGKVYQQNDTIGGMYRYSLEVNDTLTDCDTAGMSSFVGKIQFDFFGGPQMCEFKGGEDLAECPDNVLISQSENCLVFELQEGVGVLPDSVKLNDTIYYSMGYDPDTPDAVWFLRDTAEICDTASMNRMPLGDTLYLGQKACTFRAGILPISILAFDYQNEDNGVALSWEVNSEEPTQKLYLQKSYDGVDWMNVYEQSLENYTSGQTMEGAFTDLSIEQPKLYYRLYISGYSGEEKYSNILPVAMKDQVINTLFYQSQSRSIMIKAGRNFTGEMHLINAQGQQVMTQKIQIQKNSYQEVDVRGDLSPGIYFVNFDNGLIAPSKIFID